MCHVLPKGSNGGMYCLPTGTNTKEIMGLYANLDGCNLEEHKSSREGSGLTGNNMRFEDTSSRDQTTEKSITRLSQDPNARSNILPDTIISHQQRGNVQSPRTPKFDNRLIKQTRNRTIQQNRVNKSAIELGRYYNQRQHCRKVEAFCEGEQNGHYKFEKQKLGEWILQIFNPLYVKIA